MWAKCPCLGAQRRRSIIQHSRDRTRDLSLVSRARYHWATTTHVIIIIINCLITRSLGHHSCLDNLPPCLSVLRHSVELRRVKPIHSVMLPSYRFLCLPFVAPPIAPFSASRSCRVCPYHLRFPLPSPQNSQVRLYTAKSFITLSLGCRQVPLII